MTCAAILLAAMAVAGPVRTNWPAIGNPYAAGPVLQGHDVWDGDRFIWCPADTCPICHNRVRPLGAWTDAGPEGIFCPHCTGISSEVEWDRFNFHIAPYRRRMDQ